ncbi:AfsR/SARP family transcriptional regulator [Glycomyces tritici]|uniref:BTAD domain-containing putative transcriptional regulator n=1 Tax=Glycomyces tritici TaxID=2665176 RepID=A0ABT7YWT8_9ACTN|nr:BTAD domain-containing putative transcriptional regulator [Glycomyces tritici]MDN3243111.1 BTAD domain-containing putative transcriptional regulator [Glycomyces tritici]
MTETMRIGLLGPFQVTAEGLPKTVAGGRQRAVLAALALSAGKPVRSSTLAALVWGEDAPPARHRLHAVVNRLRQAIGAEALRAAPGEYTLVLDPDAVDVHRFRSLAAESKHAEGAAELALLDRALGLWRGDPLIDIDAERLVAAHAPALFEERLRALERRADLMLEEGGHAELVAELSELTTAHPLREFLWSRLMLALHRSGRQAEALAAYQRVRTLLADRLGVDPGEELQRVHRTVLRPLSGPPPEPAATRPAALLAVPAPRQLAIDTPGFTGRADSLTELDRLLDADEAGGAPVTIAVISGPAGVGKTTLAVHWAHRVADRFPDGQLHLNLSGRGTSGSSTADAALMTVLLSLGTPPQRIPPDTEGRSAALRTALSGRRVLMLLDNARDADQVRPLLPGSGSLVLATSRNRLRSLRRHEGARLLELDPFTPAESAALLRRVLGSATVSDHPGAIAELTGLCGHLPLAVALAAERVRNTGIALPVLVEEARDDRARLDALDDGADDVRKVFSWSYRALPPQAAMMFRTLSAAPGPDIGASAAAALTGTAPPVALRLLESLVDHNLLRRHRPGRYELHDLLRVYAAELGAAIDGEQRRTQALARVLDWYIATGLDAWSHVQPTSMGPGLETPRTEVAPLVFADAPSALDWFETEQDNLIAAVGAAESAGLDRACWRLVHLLWAHLDRCRAWPEIASLGAIGLGAARRAGDGYGEAEMLTMGASLRHLGRFDEAIASQERALVIYREQESLSGQATVLNNLGMIFRSMGRHEEAIEHLRRCVALDERTGEPGDLAVSLLNLAQSYIEGGRAPEAIETAGRSLELLRELAHRRGQGRAMETIGLAHGQIGEHGVAASWLRRASEVFAGIGDRWHQSGSLTGLGRALRADGRADEADAVLEQALELAVTLDDPRAEEIRRLLADRDGAAAPEPRRGDAAAHAGETPGDHVAGRS